MKRQLHGSDPSGRNVAYAETGQTGVAEIAHSWSPSGDRVPSAALPFPASSTLRRQGGVSGQTVCCDHELQDADAPAEVLESRVSPQGANKSLPETSPGGPGV